MHRSRSGSGHQHQQGRFSAYLRNHWLTLQDCIKGLVATPLSSAMTVFVIAIALLLPGLLSLVAGNLETLGSGFRDSASITLFLHDEVPEERGRELSNDLLQEFGFEAAQYLSRAAALAEFEAESGFGQLLTELAGNPLPASITISPGIAEPTRIQRVVGQLQDRPEVESAQLDLLWIQRLTAIQELLGRASRVLTVVLGMAVLFIVGNTVRMGIENRRREIDVVKLVGGTYSYIARPFLYGGLLLGMAGAAVACGLLMILQLSVGGAVDRLLSLYGSAAVLQGMSFNDALRLVGLGGALGWLGAALSVAARLYSSPP